jgi:hypothetical protein
VLLFSWPIWLWATPVVAAAGAWALWRGQRRGRVVSSVRLWQGLTAGSEVSRRRVIDPVWVIVWLGAILAALALSGATWTAGESPAPWATMQWSVRSMSTSSAGKAEAWVRLLEMRGAAGRMILVADDGGHRIEKEVSLETLRAGLIVPLDGSAKRVTLSLRDGSHVLAQQTFEWVGPNQPFGVIAVAGAQGIDPALRRVFAVQPGARMDDPTIRPAVVLLNDPADSSWQDLAAGGLLVAQPAANLPGLVVGTRILAPDAWQPMVAETQMGVGVSHIVKLDHVRITALREATVSSDWHVLATAGDKPWLAIRAWQGVTLLWLASDPSSDTNWPKDPSFVIFFAELLQRAIGSANANAIVEWRPVNSNGTDEAHAQRREYPLNGGIALAAVALWVAAAGILVWRGRS